MTTNQSGTCRCGCRAAVTNNYRPGHDARHVAVVVRRVRDLAEDVKAGRRPSHDLITPVEYALRAMPTEALRAKLVTRLVKMGWLVFGREARGMDAYRAEGLARYGSSGLDVAWRRTFPGVRSAGYTTDEFIGLLAAAGWDRHSAALAAS